MSNEEYTGNNIKRLTGIEHVRHRTSMYIPDQSTAGLHHLLWEVIDNSVDEYMGGHATKIMVSIDTVKNIATVQDNGRGIPVDIHPQTGKPTIESIFTETMMGGKFENGEGAAYKFSGGLHGIGAKATCALSDRMTVWTSKPKKLYRVDFSRGTVVNGLATTSTTNAKMTGTKVMFRPDSDIFGSTKLDPNLVRNRMKGIAYLCPGLKMLLKINGGDVEDFSSNDGLSGLLSDRLGKKEEPAFDTPISFTTPIGDNGQSIDVSMWWTDGDGEEWYSYVNMIPVPEGGTHIMGAKSAIAKELRKHCSGGVKVTSDDLRDGLRVASHIRLISPHFEGQTKNKLNNPEVQSQAEKVFSDAVGLWLSRNPDITKKLVARAIEMAKARDKFRASRKLATQNSYAKDPSSRRGLPTKLNVALSCTPEEREIFIVEGDSAGIGAARGRNGKYQEILPLKGKIPNIIRENDPAKLAAFFQNAEINDIIRAVGCGHDMFTPGESCDPRKARGKVILLMDADADGGHIACLLVGFFLRFMLPLVQAGKLWIVHPPLYVAKWGNNRVYGTSMEEVQTMARKKGCKNPQISRFKGLGEMNPDQLAETTLRPEARRTQIIGDEESLMEVSTLMGGNSAARKEMMGMQ